jgi:intracellular sulfur oxidation DsrE/DsrF family protein
MTQNPRKALMSKVLASVLIVAPLFAVLVSLGADGSREPSYPRIEGHGAVVRLADAAEQPRAGSKICVDLTKGGPATEINPGLAKAARFVNIYAGAGKKPAAARISVVLHGDATLIVLTDKAYSQKFDVEKNPNLELIRDLNRAGVELLVCGQSLAAKKCRNSDVVEEVQVAVSALTANVNRQQDGYAYIPLH